MEKLSHAGTRSAGGIKSAALRSAICWPQFASRSTLDIGFDILANAPCDCQACGWTSRLRDFGRYITERAGMKIIDCRCPDCGTAWKRIEV